MTPAVSVVVAAWNAEGHLGGALESLAAQTLREIEVIVVDDASTDGTHAVAEAFAARDPRVRVLRNEANRGPYPSANRALAEVRAPVVARLDADDVAHPERLARQKAFLDAHPRHLQVGSGYRSIDGAGATRFVKVKPMDDWAVRWIAQLRMPIEHSGMAFRARLPDGTPVRYREDARTAQDCVLVRDLLAQGRAAVLREVLLDYRMHDANLTSTRGSEQRRVVREVALGQFRAARPDEDHEAWGRFLDTYLLGRPATPALVREAVDVVARVAAADMARHPARRRWIARQAAEVLADGLLARGGGAGRPAVLAAFLARAGGRLGTLAMRVLENRHRLPEPLTSYPDPGW